MIKGMIFDIAGVLEYQGEVYPCAVDTIQQLRNYGLAVRFLTNSTLESRASCTRILREKGFIVFEEEVFTASSIATAYLMLLQPRSSWIMLDGKE